MAGTLKPDSDGAERLASSTNSTAEEWPTRFSSIPEEACRATRSNCTMKRSSSHRGIGRVLTMTGQRASHIDGEHVKQGLVI